jgi:hypothetical protein
MSSESISESVSELVSDLVSVREQMSALRAREAELKHAIHRDMNALYTNTITTHNGFLCTRKVMRTKTIRRENVPEEIWLEYAQERDAVQLFVKRLS